VVEGLLRISDTLHAAGPGTLLTSASPALARRTRTGIPTTSPCCAWTGSRARPVPRRRARRTASWVRIAAPLGRI